MIYFKKTIKNLHVESNMKIMKNDTVEIQSYEELKKMFSKNPKDLKDLINEIPDSGWKKIGDISFVDNNENFNKIRNFFFNNGFSENIKIYENPIHSGVEGNDGKTHLTIANSVTILNEDGSLLRFLPSKVGGIVISRLFVTPKNQSKGYGTMLMNLFLSIALVSIKKFPEIELECTGSLNVGSKVFINPISSQTKFFRKFGFRVVKEESEYPEYVKMKFDFSKFVENEENIKKIITK
jgi:GNAT superfamily N-acetyltransferase